MGKIIIHLKQHTPIWHFQANEAGCTLRATEVKPKLDRFIIEQLGDKGSVPDGYWTDISKKNDSTYHALDYKLKFQPKGISDLRDIYSCATFFANMGDNEDKKELVFYPDGISMTLFSLNNELLNTIVKYINSFFAFHNFGTRQSKGFGSFYIAEDDQLYKPIAIVSNDTRHIILSSFSVEENKPNYQKLFSNIDIFYKSIRSGINVCGNICFNQSDCKMSKRINNLRICTDKSRCDYKQSGSIFYCKSLLFKYLNSGHQQWDKKTIKQIINNEINPQEVSKKKYHLYRDLLGLATDVQYGRDSLLVKRYENNLVQRFKSPIFIKPIINNDIYIVYVGYVQLENEENILNKRFEIEITQRNTDRVSFSINTPSEFNLEKYFEYLLKAQNGRYNFEIRELIGSRPIRFRNRAIRDAVNEVTPQTTDDYITYKRLRQIYKELRQNYKQINYE